MAANAVFTNGGKFWAVTVPATFDTNIIGSAGTPLTNYATLVTGGASGSLITSIKITLLASISTTATQVNFFLYDGTASHLFHQQIIPLQTISTTTSADSELYRKYFTDLVIPSGSTIRVTVTTASGQSNLKCLAFGGDF